jgi:hypothetical protein
VHLTTHGVSLESFNFFQLLLAKSFWNNTKCYLKATLIASKRFCKVTPCVTLRQLNFMLSFNNLPWVPSKTSLACPKTTCTYIPMAQTCKASWTPTHHGLSSYATTVVLTRGPLYARWTCTKGHVKGGGVVFFIQTTHLQFMNEGLCAIT